MKYPPDVKLKVWGPWACFTRPELKVERVSYPVMTPSAARGVLDAILFKKVTDPGSGAVVPAFRWHIRRITVLRPWWPPEGPEGAQGAGGRVTLVNPGSSGRSGGSGGSGNTGGDAGGSGASGGSGGAYRFASLKRNEIADKVPARRVRQWARNPELFEPYRVDSAGRGGPDGAHRVQRHTLMLRDVAYLIEASLKMLVDSPTDPPIKYREMFERRLARGQCFHQPYLGCREFACAFAAPDGQEEAVAWDEDLGTMLYDIELDERGERRPGFFDAAVRQGVLHCDTEGPSPWGAAPVTIRGWENLALAGGNGRSSS